jgi:DNA polymerase III epsilon subunit-like protein
MVQLAWLLMDNDANEIASAEHIIRPEGFVIPAAAARIHGISTERALMDGIPIRDALTPLAAAIGSASTLVAHNVSFDEKILGAEFIRAGQRNPLESKSRKCTMKSAASFCRIPGPYGFKWPTLTELHRALFTEPFEDAHNALADVRACARCFFELRRLGVMA